MSRPRVSVVMAVKDYNNEYLDKAMGSILNQTFKDFELIIVDGASTDGTSEKIQSNCDNRINHIILDNDPGFTKMLEIGVDISKGDYIARHDADDISDPTRFERQVEFLDEHPEISILGTSVYMIDENGNVTSSLIVDYDHDRAVKELRYGCPFAHGSVMIRREVFNRYNYDPQLPMAQDYDLWLRISKNVEYRFRVIPDPLYYLREHKDCVSNKNWIRQFVCTEYARLRCIGDPGNLDDVMYLINNGLSRSRMRFIAYQHRKGFYFDNDIILRLYHIFIVMVTQPDYWLNEVTKKIEGDQRNGKPVCL